jgi:hypothetical protein
VLTIMVAGLFLWTHWRPCDACTAAGRDVRRLFSPVFAILLLSLFQIRS